MTRPRLGVGAGAAATFVAGSSSVSGVSTVLPAPGNVHAPRWQPLPSRGREPSRLGDVLDRTLRSFGTPTSVSGMEVVFERWPEVVGDGMAARTRPARIDGDCLVVACDEPAVATHVRFLQAQLVDRVGQLSGDRRLTRIEVRVDRARRGPRPPRPARARRA